MSCIPPLLAVQEEYNNNAMEITQVDMTKSSFQCTCEFPAPPEVFHIEILHDSIECHFDLILPMSARESLDAPL